MIVTSGATVGMAGRDRVYGYPMEHSQGTRKVGDF